MPSFTKRPSHGTVVAYLALFVALGGGAYAAGIAPRNSVDSKSIINGQVKSADVARGAIGASKLAGHAVTGNRLAPGAVTATKLGAGAVSSGALANGAVTGTKLAADAVTGANVVDDSLTGADIAEGTLGTVPHATTAGDASTLGGLSSGQFVQGTGKTFAGRTTFVLGGGGLQHVLTVPGFGEVVGGCGSGGGAIGFVNHTGHDLRVYAFAGTDQPPVTFADGTLGGLFPSGVGSAGTTTMQIGDTDVSDPHLLTVIATRDAQTSNHCAAQAVAMTTG